MIYLLFHCYLMYLENAFQEHLEYSGNRDFQTIPDDTFEI